MRKTFTILLALLLTASVFLPKQADAQSPEKMSYQAVIRKSNLELVTNTAIGMQISILQGSESGTAVYVETQTPTTNTNGLASIELGAGVVVSGVFSAIDWANGPYYIKTETDPSGGTAYTITGTSELLSVPFALHANETDPSVPKGTSPGEMQYWNGTEWAIVASGNEGDILTFVNGTPAWMGEQTVGVVENPATGKTWMDRNMGASQVATSLTDSDAYGDLYQWGRLTDGHQFRTSDTTSVQSGSDIPGHNLLIVAPGSALDWRNPQNNNLWQGVDGINNPCPTGYRLPTDAEWTEEIGTWDSPDAAGAFNSVLKLTQAGNRGRSSGVLRKEGETGNYWSSTADETKGRDLAINGATMYSDHRAFGFSVRCIKD